MPDLNIKYNYLTLDKDKYNLEKDTPVILIGRSVIYRDDNLINFITYGCWIPLFFSDFFRRKIK